MATRTPIEILLVDDDEMVLEVCLELLAGAGYGVQTAVNGMDALEKLKGSAFDLMIVDINMPRLDGIDLYNSAIKEYRYLKGRCLFITGDLSGEMEAASVVLQMENNILKKPFTKKDFLSKVKLLSRQ